MPKLLVPLYDHNAICKQNNKTDKWPGRLKESNTGHDHLRMLASLYKTRNYHFMAWKYPWKCLEKMCPTQQFNADCIKFWLKGCRATKKPLAPNHRESDLHLQRLAMSWLVNRIISWWKQIQRLPDCWTIVCLQAPLWGCIGQVDSANSKKSRNHGHFCDNCDSMAISNTKTVLLVFPSRSVIIRIMF